MKADDMYIEQDTQKSVEVSNQLHASGRTRARARVISIEDNHVQTVRAVMVKN